MRNSGTAGVVSLFELDGVSADGASRTAPASALARSRGRGAPGTVTPAEHQRGSVRGQTGAAPSRSNSVAVGQAVDLDLAAAAVPDVHIVPV